LKMILSSILRRRSRMLIALLAVAIGGTILSGLVTIYYDVPRQMGQELRSYGANLMITSVDAESMSKEEVDAAIALVSADKMVGVSAYRYETMLLNRLPFMVGGVDFDAVQKTRPYWYLSGTYPAQKKEILVGQSVAQTIAAKIGSEITLTANTSRGKTSSAQFTITGILQTGGSEEDCLYMSLSDMEELFLDSGLVDVAECSISANAGELNLLVKEMKAAVPGIEPRLVKQVTQSEGTVLTKLQSLVWIVTLVVLILTMVCVATTMTAVVAERRKEIGLKKSLGASNQSIVMEFLGEGLFLGAFGGILGVILGFIFAQEVSLSVFHRGISFQPLLIPLTIIVSIAITGLSCLLPVRSATEVDPALVLKGE